MVPILLELTFGGLTPPFTIRTYGVLRVAAWLLLGATLIRPAQREPESNRLGAAAALYATLLLSALFAHVAWLVHLVGWFLARHKGERLLLAAFSALFFADTYVRTFPLNLIAPAIVVTALVITHRKWPLFTEGAARHAPPAIAGFLGVLWLGCFAAGCHHGSVCELPWCMTFPSGSVVFEDHAAGGLLSYSDVTSRPVHPLQLYGALAYALAVVTLLFLGRRSRVSLAWLLLGLGLAALLVEVLLWTAAGEDTSPARVTTTQRITAALILALGLHLALFNKAGRSGAQAIPPSTV